MILEQRHVLVRGGVEDDVGAESVEHLEEHVAVADVDQHLLGLHVEDRRGVVEVGLVAVEEHDAGRVEAGDLPSDLAADRTGAGDEHRLAAEQAADCLEVGDDLLAPEQVFDAKVAHVAHRGRGADDVPDTRQDLQRDTCLVRGRRDPFDQRPVGRRDREHDLLGVEALQGLAERVGAADDRHAEQRQTLLALVVVDHRDREETRRSGCAPSRARSRPPPRPRRRPRPADRYGGPSPG